MRTTFSTSSPLDFARTPLDIKTLSSNPTLTCPPSMIARAARGNSKRPTPATVRRDDRQRLAAGRLKPAQYSTAQQPV